MARIKPCILIILIVLLTSCQTSKGTSKKDSGIETEPVTEQQQTQQTAKHQPKPKEKEPEIVSASLIAVGDNLIHSPIYTQAENRAKAAKLETKDTNIPKYLFDSAYTELLPFVELADFAFINQETLVAPSFTPSTYPRFCSPKEMGDFVLDSGFNMISIANNHMLDKEEAGLRDSLNYWKNQDRAVVSGAFFDKEDMDTVRIIEKNSIKLGFVAFTSSLNGLTLPEKSKLQIGLANNEAQLEKMIKDAKSKSDLVVVSAHWGEEYKTKPNKTQTELAQKLADWGADIIIGTHPHVLQPIEELRASDGRRVLVAYSLGNLISSQNEGQRVIGGLLSMTIEKNLDTGETQFSNVSLLPLVTNYGNGFANISIYPITKYTPDLASRHGVKRFTNNFNYNYILKQAQDIIPAKYLVLPETLFTNSPLRYQVWIMR
ncbi:MAG: CapA family protein [Spirochaetaceae bacterium]|nr:CapA family protein [Spirochaetaceae bacterium]